MGGGPKPVNSGQAASSSANANAATQQSLAQSTQNAAYQKQLMGKLFGSGVGSDQGSLGGMLDPSKLNDANLSGAYKEAYNQGTNQLSSDYSNQKGSLAQAWANKGMTSGSTPSGFQADQERQLGSAEADSRGSAFTSALGAQHQETLNNFWNAGNIASGNAASTGQLAGSNAGNAGSTATGIFSTAGKQAQTGTSAQTGITEAAVCPISGSKILMWDGKWKSIEELKKGDRVLSIDGTCDDVVADPHPTDPQRVFEFETVDGSCRVSLSHCFVRPGCGFVLAEDGTRRRLLVETVNGTRQLRGATNYSEDAICWELKIEPSHVYCVDGFWSLA